MIRFDKKWRNIAAFALGIPTTIFSVSLLLQQAVNTGTLTKKISNMILVMFIVQCVAVLVWYAVRKKN